jgi:hypothetical protein
MGIVGVVGRSGWQRSELNPMRYRAVNGQGSARNGKVSNC